MMPPCVNSRCRRPTPKAGRRIRQPVFGSVSGCLPDAAASPYVLLPAYSRELHRKFHDARSECARDRRAGLPILRQTFADALPRNDEASEIFQEPSELRVAGGICDTAMEGKILVDRRIAARNCAFRSARKHRQSLTICGACARSAASPADSISTPVRNSMISSASCSECSSSSAMRNGRRACSATKAPTPCRTMNQACRPAGTRPPRARRCG